VLRQTPSLEAAEAFLVAARTPSFRAGAAELALSPSAFSRRIQLLESFVGAPLFDRSGPTPQLTELGARYLEEIAPALDVIRNATRRLRARDEVVRVTASHSIAVTWLMPRLNSLSEQGLEVELTIRQGCDRLREGQADLAIVGGEAAPTDFDSEVLIDLEAFLVSAPVLPTGAEPPQGIDDLAGHSLLNTEGSQALWLRWFEQVGQPSRPPRQGAVFPTLHAMYEASASGLGLALAVPLASERLLADGRLIRRMEATAAIGSQYRIAYADRRGRRRAAVNRVADWLGGQAQASREQFRGTPISAHVSKAAG